jgi:hypothetical protein
MSFHRNIFGARAAGECGITYLGKENRRFTPIKPITPMKKEKEIIFIFPSYLRTSAYSAVD